MLQISDVVVVVLVVENVVVVVLVVDGAIYPGHTRGPPEVEHAAALGVVA